MTHKDILQIQRDHIRVLAYESDLADHLGLTHIELNLVVGAEDMTISWADFERLLEIMSAVEELLPSEIQW